MALENPDVLIVGLDLVPNSVRRVPPNCRFITHDLSFGLSKYYNTFDVVHMRSVAGGVSPSFLIGLPPSLCGRHLAVLISATLQLRSFTDSVQEAVKCLRPGGVFLLVEGDFELYREDMITFQEPRNDKFRDGSWAAKHAYGTHAVPFFLGPPRCRTVLYLNTK
jgi:hypothetical protein